MNRMRGAARGTPWSLPIGQCDREGGWEGGGLTT